MFAMSGGQATRIGRPLSAICDLKSCISNQAKRGVAAEVLIARQKVVKHRGHRARNLLANDEAEKEEPRKTPGGS